MSSYLLIPECSVILTTVFICSATPTDLIRCVVILKALCSYVSTPLLPSPTPLLPSPTPLLPSPTSLIIVIITLDNKY